MRKMNLVRKYKKNAQSYDEELVSLHGCHRYMFYQPGKVQFAFTWLHPENFAVVTVEWWKNREQTKYKNWTKSQKKRQINLNKTENKSATHLYIKIYFISLLLCSKCPVVVRQRSFIRSFLKVVNCHYPTTYSKP